MELEHKSVSLTQFKMLDTGPGGFEGYVSTFGELDDVGDIVLPGAYKETLPRYLKRGFGSDSHDWRFSTTISYPTEAHEDEQGFFIRHQFYSTDDAQRSRTKARERAQAGLDVPLSIGYMHNIPPIVIFPKDYASELPKYIRPDLLSESIVKAQQFLQVQALPGIELYESGIVTVPALQSALISNVKGGLLGDGIPYTAFLRMVGDANRELVVRTERRLEMRAKEGREFSSANVAELEQVTELQGESHQRLVQLLERTRRAPADEDQEEAAKTLLMEMLRTTQINARYQEMMRN